MKDEKKKLLKAKYSMVDTYLKIGYSILRFLLLLGLTFVIIYPFLSKISAAFMSKEDVMDSTVWFIPRSPTFSNIVRVLQFGEYWEAFGNTLLISLVCAVLQMFISSMVGYGLAKFKFRGRGILFAFVILTIIIPTTTIYTSLYLHFRYFDVFGIIEAITGSSLKLVDNISPMVLLSLTGFGLKNGLFIFVMRQFYLGVPKELNEAALVDGSNPIHSYFAIMYPLSRSMRITVFILSFAWQWTDTFYSGLFFRSTVVLPNILDKVAVISSEGIVGNSTMSGIMTNTAVLLIVLPLFIFFLFAQKLLVQGIERSGLVG